MSSVNAVLNTQVQLTFHPFWHKKNRDITDMLIIISLQ